MKIFKPIIVSLVIFGTAMIYHMNRFGYGFNDGFWRTLMSPFEGTIFSERFSEEGFNKIILGMSSSEVLRILGEPIRKSCDKVDCFWIYTWQNSGTADFDQRWIVLDLNDRVVEIRKSFFID